jgi:hypothetical protein
MKKLLGILVIGLLWCNVGFAETSQSLSSTEIYKACKVTIRLSNDDSQATPQEIVDMTKCTYYLTGLLRGAELQGYLDYKLQNDLYENILRACQPSEVTIRQVMRIFVKFLDDHPEKLHLFPATIVHLSLSEVFPCN